MSYEYFVCQDETGAPLSTCRGIVISTKKPCKYPARDINGFCQKHIKQSKAYQKNHPWSVISAKDHTRETFTKVNGIVENSILSSNTNTL